MSDRRSPTITQSQLNDALNAALRGDAAALADLTANPILAKLLRKERPLGKQGNAMSAARDKRLCKLARDAFKRSRIAWRYATPAQTHEWCRDSRIFIDAPPATARQVNEIVRWMRWGLTPRAALKRTRDARYQNC